MVDIVNSFTIKKDKRESEKEANENEFIRFSDGKGKCGNKNIYNKI